MEELLGLRNKEHASFKFSVQDDGAAIEVLNMAMKALSKFYVENLIDLSLTQVAQTGGASEDPLEAGPEYTVDEDKAPGMPKGEYKGAKEPTKDIMSILEMITQDVQKGVDAARKEDDLAQQQYEESRGALKKVLHATRATKVATEKEVAALSVKVTQAQALHTQSSEELASQQNLKAALASDCGWVATDFEPRREARKKEMEGLQEAQNVLAGASAGAYFPVNLD